MTLIWPSVMRCPGRAEAEQSRVRRPEHSNQAEATHHVPFGGQLSY